MHMSSRWSHFKPSQWGQLRLSRPGVDGSLESAQVDLRMRCAQEDLDRVGIRSDADSEGAVGAGAEQLEHVGIKEQPDLSPAVDGNAFVGTPGPGDPNVGSFGAEGQ